jgi:hypothetical protein
MVEAFDMVATENPVVSYYSNEKEAKKFADSLSDYQNVNIVKIPSGNLHSFMAVEFEYDGLNRIIGMQYYYPFTMSYDFCKVDMFVPTKSFVEFESTVNKLMHYEMHTVFYVHYYDDSTRLFSNERELKHWENQHENSSSFLRLTGRIDVCVSQTEIDEGLKLFVDSDTGVFTKKENHDFNRNQTEVLVDLKTMTWKYLPYRFPPGRPSRKRN